MKVFETFDSPTVRKNPENEKTPAPIDNREGKKVKGKKTNAIKTNERPNLSAEDIRAKVANRNAPNVADKVEISSIATKKKLFEFGDVPAPVIAEKTVAQPDVGLNDPSDPATVGKLKKLIDQGAVQFSPKERDGLSKIITDK